MTRFCWLPLVLVGLVRPAVGAEPGAWAKLLFKHTTHDFGVVARGAVVEHRFPMENPFVEDVRIASVSSTCGCTKVSATKKILKTYETGEIVAVLDTRQSGQKDATITVEFDQPFPAKFQLKTTSFIRSDVVFEPGVVQFGTVAQGQTARKRVTVMYAGRATWKILDVSTHAPYLGLEIEEVGRATEPRSRATQVTYDLWVTLKDTALPGYFKDQVFVRTDDPNQQASRIPIVVEGLVIPAISVNPAVLMLGVVAPGQAVSRNLVVRGHKPFRILDVSGPDDQFRFTLPQGTKEVQVIGVEYRAADRPGKVSGKIRITTDVPGTSVLQASVDAMVVAPTGVAPSAEK